MVNYIDPREWKKFPPDDSFERLNKYKEYSALLMGEHNDVFCHDKLRLRKSKSEVSKVLNAAYDAKEQSEVIYVTTNYCKIASQLFANMLFGKSPKISIEGDQGERQKRLEKMIENNMLSVLNHQQEIEASSLGDAFYRIRWGRMANWHEEGAVIEAVQADHVFPILTPGSAKDNQGFCLATEIEHGKRNYLYKEIHLVGVTVHQLFALDGDEIGDQVPLDSIPHYAPLMANAGKPGYTFDGLTLQYETGYDGLFIEHVPNWTRPDRFFGISDYSPDVVSNQAAINETKTGILRTCLKHMDPILAVPNDLFEYDEQTDSFYAKREDLQAIGLDPEASADLPRYITWDAKLDAAVTNIESCFEAMMMSFGISPSIFGFDKYGQADSGTALKLRMTHTLMLVNQKRTYFDAALKNVLYAAQFLDGTYGKKEYKPIEVSITWPEPLPDDLKEQAEAFTQLINIGLYSRETAVARVQSLDGDALQAEMDKISNDRIGNWITTVGLPLLNSGAIDNEQFVKMVNALTLSDEDVGAAERPVPEAEEE